MLSPASARNDFRVGAYYRRLSFQVCAAWFARFQKIQLSSQVENGWVRSMNETRSRPPFFVDGVISRRVGSWLRLAASFDIRRDHSRCILFLSPFLLFSFLFALLLFSDCSARTPDSFSDDCPGQATAKPRYQVSAPSEPRMWDKERERIRL